MRYLIPVVVLAALVVLFVFGLHHDPREVPSPLIGKSAPNFNLKLLGDGTSYSTADLNGRPVLVNFFASWCEGCQVEHPVLLKLAKEFNVEIIGMDYKDKAEDVSNWLARHGNPYRKVVMDEEGTAGLDWGVYGVPETFVLNASGVIVFKQIGPMTEEVWREKIAPLMSGATP